MHNPWHWHAAVDLYPPTQEMPEVVCFHLVFLQHAASGLHHLAVLVSQDSMQGP